MRILTPVAVIIAALFIPTKIVYAADASKVTSAITGQTTETESILLSRQFVAMLYPTAERDMFDQFRATYIDSLEEIEPEAFRAEAKTKAETALKAATPVISRHQKIVMEAYAQAYAREYSLDELRQLVGFALTPVGRHFLNKIDSLDFDPAVEGARMAMFDEVDGQFIELKKLVCKRITEERIAAGEKDAKCRMA